MAWARHVGVDLYQLVSWGLPAIGVGGHATYTTVGTVGSSSLLGSLVDLDVLDDEVAGVEALGVGVGLGVLQQGEEELCRLDGPASSADTGLLAYHVTCQPYIPLTPFTWPISSK